MKKKYKLLAVGFLLGIGIPFFFTTKFQQKCIDRWKKESDKNRGLFLLMDQWANIKQEGKNLEVYFVKNNYKKIAIYGMGYVGIRLVKELKYSEIEIAYGIDRNADTIYSDIKLITMDSSLEDVDAIVITTMEGYDEICEALSERVKCSFISIEDILNEI